MSTSQTELPRPTPASRASFMALLRQYRLAAGLSQEALAERAGLSVQAISLLENGKRQAPYRHTVTQLARALDLSTTESVLLEAAVVRRRLPVGATPAPGAASFENRAGVASPCFSPSDSIPNNLPRQLTSFVGREREIVELAGLLASTRLLNLTGAGGCGKTRLALEAATQRGDRYADGVWFVDLAPLTDPALVLPAIAQALGVRNNASRPLAATLTDALHARHLLLVLDNCEHLIEACAVAAAMLLQACPQMQILATSREALRIAGETSWRVPSLTVPDPQTGPSLQTLTQSEAVRLFRDRATTVEPRFALTQANAQAVAEICQRLDGMPLALELAAARLRVLTVEELAARLDQRFRLLTGGSRTALPRQRTLQATVEWSYALLLPQEQTLFDRLSVFAGGWRVEGAEALGACEGITTEEVLDLLGRLVEKSLVSVEETDEARTWYRQLETLRQYGRQRLATRGETILVQRQHAKYYLTLAERGESELAGPAQLRWLDELEREHDNLRAALAWCLEWAEHEEGEEAALAAETGMRLAGALFWFWFYHDHHPEALAWLDRALAHGAAASPVGRAKALFGAGVFAWSVNDLARSEALLKQSVTLSREVGDRRMCVLALGSLGYTMSQNGQDERGAAVVEEGVALAREVGELWLLGMALLHRLLRVAYSPAIDRDGQRARAREAGVEARHLFQEAGDKMCVATVQLCLGELALHEGDYEGARAAFRSALPMMRAVGWRSIVADGLVRLADVARAQGDYGEASALYVESLLLYRQSHRQLGANLLPHITAVVSNLAHMALEQGDWTAAQTHVAESLTITRITGQEGGPGLAGALELRAALAAVQGAPLQALRLAGAASALRAQLNQPLAASEQAALERRLAPARQALSAEEQTAAWAEGQAMTSEHAIAYALDELVLATSLIGPPNT